MEVRTEEGPKKVYRGYTWYDKARQMRQEQMACRSDGQSGVDRQNRVGGQRWQRRRA